MATNVRVAMQSGAGKAAIREVQAGEVLRVDAATHYSFEVNGQPGLPAGTKFKRSADGLTLQFPDQSTLELASAQAASVDMDALAKQLGEEGAITPVADSGEAPLQVAQLDTGSIHNNIFDKPDATGSHVQYAVDDAAAGAVLAPGAGAGAGLSTGAMLGIGAGVLAVGAASGGGGGSSSSSGATPSGVTPTDPAPVDPAPVTNPTASGVPTVHLATASNSGSTSDLITSESMPTIDGTGTAGETITVTLSNGDTLSTVVAADGTWSVTPAAALADGMITFSVVEQGAGLPASAPVALAVTIDTHVTAGDVGTIGGDGVVNHAEAGAVTLTGTGAEAGASVSALISDGLGHDKTVTGTVQGDGHWSIDAGSLAGMADGNYTVAATVTDAAGNHAVSNGSFVLDTTGPATPAAPDMIAASDSGVSATDNITNVNMPAFAVDAPNVGETQSLMVDGSAVAASYDSNLGTMTPTVALADGQHAISYQLTDAHGNSSTSAALTVTIDTVQATPAAAPDMTAATDTGPSNSDNATGNAMPDFTIAALGAGETAELYIDGVLADTTFDAGTNTFSMNTAIPDGAHFTTYWVHDAAGNTSGISPALSFSVSTAAPAQTVTVDSVTDSFGPVTGTLTTGALTDDVAPDVNGTLSAGLNAGEHLVVYRDGVALGDATVTNTSWTYADTGLADGNSYVYTAQVANAVGQNGTISADFNLTENANYTRGGTGVDTLYGDDAGGNNLWGGAGADVLIGGTGSDYARYDYSAASLTVDLANPNNNTGEAAGDSYTSINGLVGSNVTGAGDTLTGDAGNNDIRGLSGDDVINGGGGNDYIMGGSGSNTLTGGAGNDNFVFFPNGGAPNGNQNGDASVVTDFSSDAPGSNNDTITLRAVTSFDPNATGYAAQTAAGEVDIDASVAGGDLVLHFHDVTSNADSTVTLTGRADLYHTDSTTTIADLLAANQLAIQAV